MTKSLAAILIAVAAALVSDAPAASQARDLWIGVVDFTDPYNNHSASDPSTVLEPVGALVGGRWWSDSRDDQTVVDAFNATRGKVPAQWLPPGMELPSSWQAHLLDKRRVSLRTSGPLHTPNDDLYRGLSVKTDLKVPRTTKEADNDGGYAKPVAVAVAGDVGVQFFVDLPASRHAELLKFVAASMLAAERAEIQRQAEAGKGIENALPNDADAKALLSQLASAPREIDIAKTATQNGRPVYLIEGYKKLTASVGVGLIHTGAAAERDRSGALRLLGTWSILNFDENAYGSDPLAVIERNGEGCWLIGHGTEGGQHYVLARPGQIDPAKFTFTCDIK